MARIDQLDYEDKSRSPGQMTHGGMVLKESAPFMGDDIGRPYVVRLVLRHHPVHPFVVWVYFIDSAGGRGYGEYCEALGEGLARYRLKCSKWQVDPDGVPA